LTEASGRQFAAFTSANVGKKAEIRVGGRALMAPVIREPILGGSGQIAAGFKVEEAKELADRLSSRRARMEVEAVD
jgi:preprotein translocase subunit SecD